MSKDGPKINGTEDGSGLPPRVAGTKVYHTSDSLSSLAQRLGIGLDAVLEQVGPQSPVNVFVSLRTITVTNDAGTKLFQGTLPDACNWLEANRFFVKNLVYLPPFEPTFH